jgi:hypothetical protein
MERARVLQPAVRMGEENRESRECTVVEVGYPVFLQHRLTPERGCRRGCENRGRAGKRSPD